MLNVYNELYAKRKIAFTLAEVLITLGIVGVVAAMTLSSVISKYQEQAMVQRLKKTYSTLSNAFNLAISENGTVNEWSQYTPYGLGNNDVIDVYSKYLKIAINDFQKNQSIRSSYVDLNKNHNSAEYTNSPFNENGQKFILNDGTLVGIRIFAQSNSVNNWCKNPPTNLYVHFCGFINVDLNGLEKGPNMYGYDTFGFFIYSNKILPYGSPGMTYGESSINNCLSGTKGISCTAWVLTNGNMDYLHCRDKLSWNGKTSCK